MAKASSSKCVSPKTALTAAGRLKPGYRYTGEQSTTRQVPVPCIVRAGTTAATSAAPKTQRNAGMTKAIVRQIAREEIAKALKNRK